MSRDGSTDAPDAPLQACRLCLEKRPLCFSHIIPEFAYKGMYDEKHRFLAIPPDPTKRIKYNIQKGYREYLLCQSCETKLSVHEKYVAKWFMTGADAQFERRGQAIIFSELNYAHMRLCFLSILWRMSVSTLSYCERVQLGPHEEILRRMIVADDPGPPDRYMFMGILPLLEGQFRPDFMLQADSHRWLGHRQYRMVIGGMLVMFIVSNHTLPLTPEVATIQPNGIWVLLEDDVQNIGHLRQWYNETIQSHRQRKAAGLD